MLFFQFHVSFCVKHVEGLFQKKINIKSIFLGGNKLVAIFLIVFYFLFLISCLIIRLLSHVAVLCCIVCDCLTYFQYYFCLDFVVILVFVYIVFCCVPPSLLEQKGIRFGAPEPFRNTIINKTEGIKSKNLELVVWLFK